ncbi:hypothetical protein HDU86_006339 [Geranomyces michiganensis]|nr:hypothetical protein HDU86_006339 [Geranomyces michiganensis]
MESASAASSFLEALVGGDSRKITLLGRFAATASHYTLDVAKQKLKSLKPQGLGARVRDAAGVGGSSSTALGDEGAPISVLAGELISEPTSRADTAGYEEEQGESSENDESSWVRV